MFTCFMSCLGVSSRGFGAAKAGDGDSAWLARGAAASFAPLTPAASSGAADVASPVAALAELRPPKPARLPAGLPAAAMGETHTVGAGPGVEVGSRPAHTPSHQR